jgi:hypothetical protein
VIDFRYHLVSLISVFLALAVGIILGAGPLQRAIGDQLTAQVEVLRTERNALREELDQTQATLGEQERFALAAGEALATGSLTGKDVAVVDVDGLDDGVQNDVLAQLEEAGATVVATETLSSSWTAADEATLRETVANGQRDQLVADLPDVLSEESGTPELLGAALAIALTEADGADASALSDRATELRQLLVQVGLVEDEDAPSAPADVVLLLSAGATQEEAAGEATVTEDVEAAEVGVAAPVTSAGTVADVTGALVVAGPTTQAGDLVSTVRGEGDLAERVSTVSGIDEPAGRIVVPLALAAQAAGHVGQYGFEDGATVLPPVVEGVPVEVPPTRLGQDSGDQGTDGGEG